MNLRSRVFRLTWIKHLDKTDLRDSLAAVLLFVLAFPPSPLGFLAYFAIIPFLSICLRKNTRWCFKNRICNRNLHKYYLFLLCYTIFAFRFWCINHPKCDPICSIWISSILFSSPGPDLWFDIVPVSMDRTGIFAAIW